MNLEIIQMRSIGNEADGVVEAMVDLLSENDEVRIYRRIDMPGDISIHISLTGSDGNRPSVTGERIASELSSYGIVQYSLWKEN